MLPIPLATHCSPDWLLACRRYTKSVIRSRAALTYAEAQARIDDPRLHDEVNGPSCLACCFELNPCR